MSTARKTSRSFSDKFSPILHLVQTIRDEAHRFAVTFHRTRRNAQRLTSELHDIPGHRPENGGEAVAHVSAVWRE